MKEIIIKILIPDGAYVDGGDVKPVISSEPAYVPPFADELIPLPDSVIPLPDDASARQIYAQAVNTPPGFAEGAALVRTMAQNAPAGCPVHRVPWKTVPAGVSKKSGKPYAAFMACPERGCDQRPAA